MGRSTQVLVMVASGFVAAGVCLGGFGEFEERAANGDTIAQEALGIYHEGNERYDAAVLWYLKAAETGRAESQYRLGRILIHNLAGTAEESSLRVVQWAVDDGVRWLNEAAARNHFKAMGELANCYAKGIGVEQDLSEAYKWVLVASQKNEVYSHVAQRFSTGLTATQVSEGKERAAIYLAGSGERLDRSAGPLVAHARTLSTVSDSSASGIEKQTPVAAAGTQKAPPPGSRAHRPGVARFLFGTVGTLGMIWVLALMIGFLFFSAFGQRLIGLNRSRHARSGKPH